jgi:hypothetical protein
MSGANARRSSARLGLGAIGKLGVSGKGALNSRLRSRRSTGQVSPAPTSPVASFRVRLRVLPGLGPKTSVNSLIPWRSYATE